MREGGIGNGDAAAVVVVTVLLKVNALPVRLTPKRFEVLITPLNVEVRFRSFEKGSRQ
jgi:hypothetical protein